MSGQKPHADHPEAVLFAALPDLASCGDLEPMLDRVCETVLTVGDFRACVLGLYSTEGAGYGVAGNVPAGTRESFRAAYRRSTRESRAQRRKSLLKHRRPGTNIVFLPAGTGPEASTVFVPTTTTRQGSWLPDDRLMLVHEVRSGPDDLWAMLSLDDPVTGDRPDEAVLARLGALERFLSVAAVYIENLLLVARVRAQDEIFRVVLAAVPVTVALVDAEGSVLYSNRQGPDDPRPPLGEPGSSVHGLGWSPTAREGLSRLVADGTPLPATEVDLRVRDDEWVVILTGAPVRVAASVIGHPGTTHTAVVVATDAAELRALQERLIESRKMLALGRMAGGMAHQFNNLLEAVLGSVELVRERLDGGAAAPVATLLDDAAEAARRGGLLTRQLLGYARPTKTGFATLAPEAFVRAAVESFGGPCDPRIAVELELEDDLPVVDGDLELLRESVMILCRHACDAVLARLAVEVPSDIWAARIEVSVRRTKHHGCLAVAIRVRDSGHGMDAKTLAHVFEPFFERPDAADRIGVGLALAHGVAGQHGGALVADPRVGRGDAFTLVLPAREPEPTSVPSTEPSVTSGRVLVVDDQSMVRRVLAELVRMFGYTPSVAQGGEEAVEILCEEADQFAAVVLDYTMPDRDGRSVLEALRERGVRPPPVVIVTGDVSRVRADGLDDLGVRCVLPKPCRSEELRTVLGRIARQA